MKRTIAAAVLMATIQAPHAVSDGQLALEVKEWVIDPCFEVVAALTVRGYHTEPLSRGLSRAEIVEQLKESRLEPALDLMVRALNPNVDWRTRSEAYPQLLRACLQNAIDDPDL